MWWALAATLYAAVEGRGPYESRPNPIATLQAIATQRPRPMEHAGPLEPAIAAMMHEDPAQRWDMATAAKQLAAIARGGGAAAAAVPAPTRIAPVVAAGLDEPTRPWQPTSSTSSEPTGTQQPAGAAAGAATVGADAASTEPTTPSSGVAPVQAHGSDGVGDDSDVIDTRRRGKALPVLALVVVLLLLLGGYALSHRGSGRSGTPASKAPATPTTHATSSRTPSNTPTSSAASSTSASTSSPSSSPSSRPTTTAPAPATDASLTRFVRSYFANVTGNRDLTWTELTPRMQAAAGGRSGYEQFWSTITAVRVGAVQADASGAHAVARLTYVRQDGSTSTERHTFTFVRQGDSWLINGERMG